MLELDGGDPTPERGAHRKGDLDEFANEARRFRGRRATTKHQPRKRHLALWVMLALLLLALGFLTCETVKWHSGEPGAQAVPAQRAGHMAS